MDGWWPRGRHASRLSALVIAEALLVLSAVAAPRPVWRFTHPLAAARQTEPPRRTTAADTVTVVAGMVEFPPEVPDNPFTTGIGVFDTSHAAVRVLDGAPHDSAYIVGHLRFLQDYVDSVSRGRAAVRLLLLPRVARMPKTMGAYAPSPDDALNTELATFVTDAWQALDAANAGYPWPALDSTRTFFVVVHAGVGRDIDLSATYGYNPQPQDLPSVYFSLGALEAVLGNGYTGTPIAGGRMHVVNTAVIPETESRTVNGTPVYLGINGLLAASLGSFLGLPDLFNTTSHLTAIGRFGLEDVASIFAFGGFLPPAPNAWERLALGWADAAVLSPGVDRQYTLAAWQSAAAGDTAIDRVPINDREYFLLENRERNPRGRGIDVRLQVDTGIVLFHATGDVTGFQDGDLSSLSGVIIGTSNHDWSVAGSGILIWHIDQSIIDAYTPIDAINGAGHTHGVRLMEAAGGQRIGVPVQTPFGTFVSEGDVADPWFRGNEVNFPYYGNAFSDSTLPSATANDGSPSGLRFHAFDTVRARMTFNLGGTVWPRLVTGFPQSTGADPGTNPVVMGDVAGDGHDQIFLTTARGLLAWRDDGSRLIASADSIAVFADRTGIVRCATLDTVHHLVLALCDDGPSGVSLTAWSPADTNHDGRADLAWTQHLTTGAARTIAVPMCTPDGIVVGVDTTVALINAAGVVQGRMSVPAPAAGPGHVVALAWTGQSGQALAGLAEERIALLDLRSMSVVWTRDLETHGLRSLAVGGLSGDGTADVLAADTIGTIVLVHGSAQRAVTLAGGNGARQGNPSGNFAMLDALAPHGMALAVRGATDLFALNGVLSEVMGFPIHAGAAPLAAPITARADNTMPGATALMGDVVVSATSSGTLHCYAGGGSGEIARFPLALGSALHATPAIDRDLLAVATPSHALMLYTVPFHGGAWSQFAHDAQHTAFDGRSPSTTTTFAALLPPERVFNWPNPVRDKHTHIRFYVSRDAVVHVRVTNLVNELVEALPGVQATGGVDTDVDLATGDIQSGVYLVRVEAEAGGEKAVAFVKMAVIN